MKNEKNKIATDSFLLIFVQCITMSVSIIQAMILARTLPKEVYGTYSQALLVISFFAPFFSLGLSSTINYYYNRTQFIDDRKKYINTIITLSLFAGIVGGVLLITFKNNIANYYGNQGILILMLYIAFRPCVQNIIGLYQPLYISSGYTKVIAIRNLIISICQVLIVGVTSYYTQNLAVIFCLLFILDVIQLLFFSKYYSKNCFPIYPLKIEKKYVLPILKYSLPILLATSVGTISVNLDRLVISNLMSVEDYALYSNMAKELPFSFIASSFTAVVTPRIIELINNKRMNEFRELWSDYLEMGYTVTWPLCVGALIMAPQLIELLYSTKYLSNIGIIVFQIYIAVAMMRFTFYGLVPTAMGKTKVVLYYAIVGLILNIVLNYIFYYFLGMIGPPLATLFSLFISSLFYFRHALKLTDSKFIIVFRIKKACILIGEILFVALGTNLLLEIIKKYVFNCFVLFFIGYSMFVGVMFILKYRDIKHLVKRMNNQ